MTHVATLICPDVTPLLAPSLVARAAAVLPGAGTPRWLAAAVAAEIPFAPPVGIDNAFWTDALRATLDVLPIDVVTQSSAYRRKRLLVADMDSTIIEQECVDELADLIGLRDEVAAITRRSMRGEIDFDGALLRRVALLRGLAVDEAERIMRERITLTPGARTLVATMRAAGAMTAIASGGFTLFTAHVARLSGFDRHFANELVVEEGRLAGTLQGAVFGPTAKRTVLRELREEAGLDQRETLAVGDGANDIEMLAEAGLGVAFRAQPAVAAAARARIEHGDLTALLYLQGYPREAFVT
jgi:phosphoserine phosphatase